jgi:hypothetical protein
MRFKMAEYHNPPPARFFTAMNLPDASQPENCKLPPTKGQILQGTTPSHSAEEPVQNTDFIVITPTNHRQQWQWTPLV